MGQSQARIELFIDVLEEPRQRAMALADLKPPQLVEAILEEFHTMEHLGDSADGYSLVRADSREPLDPAVNLDKQVKAGDRLALVEREAPLPEGTARPQQPVYFREVHAAKAYPVQWLPAIIGRRSEHQPQNELVAVDLRAYATGLRVSRRHVELSMAGGRFYVKNLSTNPASLVSQQQAAPIPITGERMLLTPGDIIRLDRSDIELKFIVREPAAAKIEAPAEDNSGGEIEAA